MTSKGGRLGDCNGLMAGSKQHCTHKGRARRAFR